MKEVKKFAVTKEKITIKRQKDGKRTQVKR